MSKSKPWRYYFKDQLPNIHMNLQISTNCSWAFTVFFFLKKSTLNCMLLACMVNTACFFYCIMPIYSEML